MLKFFTGSTKLADAITSYPALIRLLPRFNISLGFGDKSIDTVCAECNVHTNLFLIVCNIYAFSCYRPSDEEIARTDAEQLISYLKKSHDQYFDNRIPHIEKHIKILTEQIDSKCGSVLMSIFKQYKKEVREHFDLEENTIFPILQSLQQNGNSALSQFNGYEEAHTNIEDTLDDFVQIIFKYLPSNAEHENVIGMAYDILQLSEDLKKHAVIEELVLLPFIEYLGRRNQK